MNILLFRPVEHFEGFLGVDEVCDFSLLGSLCFWEGWYPSTARSWGQSSTLPYVRFSRYLICT
jgi:hypothetical protein